MRWVTVEAEHSIDEMFHSNTQVLVPLTPPLLSLRRSRQKNSKTSLNCPSDENSTAQVVCIPRRDKGIDLARAVTETQAAVMGPSVGSSPGCQDGVSVEGGLWATDPTLVAYAELISAVPDELCSVATALYGMVRERLGARQC